MDVDEGALATCRDVTAPYASALEYVQADSVAFLREWSRSERGPIHLLYLDSLDYVDREVSEAHSLAEAQAALPALADSCLVLFDDTGRDEGASNAFPCFMGKGARAVPFLRQQGFRLVWSREGQTLLARGKAGGCASSAQSIENEGCPEQA